MSLEIKTKVNKLESIEPVASFNYKGLGLTWGIGNHTGTLRILNPSNPDPVINRINQITLAAGFKGMLLENVNDPAHKWAGVYLWLKYLENLKGSNQTVSHTINDKIYYVGGEKESHFISRQAVVSSQRGATEFSVPKAWGVQRNLNWDEHACRQLILAMNYSIFPGCDSMCCVRDIKEMNESGIIKNTGSLKGYLEKLSYYR